MAVAFRFLQGLAFNAAKAQTRMSKSELSDWSADRGEKWRLTLDGTEAMLKPVDEPLIHALDLRAPLRIADIGCGGGGTTLEIMRLAPAGSVVHGFDISPALIEVAQQRKHSKHSAASFTLMDMESVTAPETLYPYRAFSNMLSWLTPNGTFAFAIWDHAAENPWLFRVRDVVANHVNVPVPGPDEPGPFRYADIDTLLELLQRVGFADLEVRNWRGRFSIGGELPPAEAANFALASFSSFGELLAQAGPGVMNDARHALTTKFSECVENGAVRLDASVHIVMGARSSQ